MSLKETYLGLVLGLMLAATGTMNAQAQEGMVPMSSDSAVVDTTLSEQESVDALSAYARGILNRFDKSPTLVTILYIVILYSIVTLFCAIFFCWHKKLFIILHQFRFS